MYTLGISCYYHDSAATLLKNGHIFAAFEEERFSRKKHDNSFPYQAIRECLRVAKIDINQVDRIAYYEKPLLKFERILQNFVETYPFSLPLFTNAIPSWLSEKINIENTLRKRLDYHGNIYFVPHHLSHASAAYFTSPFQHAAIFTADAVGEYATLSVWRATNNSITLLKSIHFPHSLGLFYSTITAFLGFTVNEDEQKVMGMAAYGKPRYVKKLQKIIRLHPDDSLCMDLTYFSYLQKDQMWSKKLERILGKPRIPGSPLTKRHMDIARSTQEIMESLYNSILTHLYTVTGEKNLCIGGGVALNALANGKIYDQTPFLRVFNFGPAGDGGGSLGAALFCYFANTRKKRQPVTTLNFGNTYDNKDIEKYLKRFGNRFSYRKYGKRALILKAAQLLSANKVLGWFQEKAEFGPRALGARSILANPKDVSMKEKINLIKKRERFQPFGISILRNHVKNYILLPPEQKDFPFMNFCFPAKEEFRGRISAVIHKDNTCRIQTVTKENGIYFDLISAFYKKTGTAGVLNTSFNLSGQPLVEHPGQAVEMFINEAIDVLVIGNFVVTKKEK
ncbi:MAG: hypothetical protein HYT10_03285 [Candidatus Levybacteria bacterium]|nr:hypothetical protein [Candidatus Levybacteria bacterium]